MRPGASDADLAAQMVLGSVSAFDELYLRHAAAVRRLGASVLRGADAVDDLVQDTFLQVWRNRARYSSGRAPVTTWIFSIARNRAIDLLRAQSRQVRLVEAARGVARCAAGVPDALAEAVARDEGGRVRAALAQLPCVQRRTLVLAYGGGLTHSELARRTGVPIGTVKSRIRLGQQSMARRLAPEQPVEAPSAA